MEPSTVKPVEVVCFVAEDRKRVVKRICGKVDVRGCTTFRELCRKITSELKLPTTLPLLTNELPSADPGQDVSSMLLKYDDIVLRACEKTRYKFSLQGEAKEATCRVEAKLYHETMFSEEGKIVAETGGAWCTLAVDYTGPSNAPQEVPDSIRELVQVDFKDRLGIEPRLRELWRGGTILAKALEKLVTEYPQTLARKILAVVELDFLLARLAGASRLEYEAMEGGSLSEVSTQLQEIRIKDRRGIEKRLIRPCETGDKSKMRRLAAKQIRAWKSFMTFEQESLPPEWISGLQSVCDHDSGWSLLLACWQIGYHGMRLLIARVKTFALTPQALDLLQALKNIMSTMDPPDRPNKKCRCCGTDID